jgi:acetylornithine deacetylase/succinyl-diaminopimelate desuccinylase-like protein
MSEAVELLSQYLRIDTTNPPGREDRGVEFLARILDREGIAYKTYEPQPGRASLRAEIPGSGEKPPLILLNHIDVVPADPAEWSFDPFGGEVKDGFVQGRGALDMKGQGIMELMAVLNLKRQGLKPNRDLVFLAVADEEMGGTWGAKWLLTHHPEDFKAGLVLNEGGYVVKGLLPDRPVAMIAAAEKGICWLKLTRSGPPGHGSLPHGDNALEKMTQALARLLAQDDPLTVTPIVAEYFRRLGRSWSFLGPYLEDGRPETLVDIISQSGLTALPQVSALLKNTHSLTVMKSGDKSNVIPSRAEAHLDVRLLPGRRAEDEIAHLRERLGDQGIEIEPLAVTESTQSIWDGGDFPILADLMQKAFPEALVAPSLVFGASDSRFFRHQGVPSYGLCPVLIDMADVKMVHGLDERISVESVERGAQCFTDLVQALCRT